MNKPVLKINFSDFWSGFNKEDNLFINLLRNKYNVQLDEQPDILIYSCYTNDFLKYDCPKIYYTAENTRPDFKECDFAFSFDLGLPADKHFRLPLYRWNGDLEKLTEAKNAEKIFAEKTKFCCMLVSNPNGKERNDFFEKLSRYKKVDSGGKHLNNIGHPVADKMQFIKDYKFVLSFENASHPGYTTEKLIEPMFVHSVPVYWGNTAVHQDFNTKSFINVHDYEDFDAAINEIIRLDTNDAAYRQYLSAPYFLNNHFPEQLQFDKIGTVLENVVTKLLNTKAVGIQNTGYSKSKIRKAKMKSSLRKLTQWSRW